MNFVTTPPWGHPDRAANAKACAKLAGLWREKVDQHTTGQIERIERIIVECDPRPDESPTTTL